jgi:flagellar hook-length control protein FliK
VERPAEPAKPAALAKPAEAAKPADPPPPAPKDAPVVKDAAPSHPARSAAEPRPVLRAERIEALVKVATRHGAAEARMELHPQELGSVVVKLRVTSEGLSATFTASNPEAVTQLQQAGDDLRRTLEAKGLTLATLDVRAQSGEAGDRREERGWGRSKDRRHVPSVDDEPASTVTTTSVPVGELVDVHA